MTIGGVFVVCRFLFLHRLGIQRIVGPTVFGIAPLQFFSHVKVCLMPEVGKVLGELHRFESRREQFHEQRLSAVVHCWCLSHTETFLQSYAHHRCCRSLTIVDAYPAARRHDDVFWSEPVYLLLLVVWYRCPDDVSQVQLFHLCHRCHDSAAFNEIHRQPTARRLHQVWS